MKIHVISLLAIRSYNAQAQTVSLGVKAGGNLSYIVRSLANEPAAHPLPGFAVGLYGKLPVAHSEKFALKAELYYNQLGYRLSNPPTQYKAIRKSYYLSLPLMLEYAHRGFFVEAGLQANYLTNIYEYYNFLDPATSVPTVGIIRGIHGYYPRWGAAGVVGTGYNWTNGLSVDLRYFSNLTGIYWRDYSSGRKNPHLAGIQLSASYLLTKKKVDFRAI